MSDLPEQIFILASEISHIFSRSDQATRGGKRKGKEGGAGQSLIPAGWTADSISLSLEERNIHNSLSERPFSSYMQIPDPKGEVVRKSKKKTPLQEFLILMGSRKDGRSRKPNGNSFIIPGEQTRNYLFLPYWLRCLSYFVFRKCCSVFLYRGFFLTSQEEYALLFLYFRNLLCIFCVFNNGSAHFLIATRK